MPVTNISGARSTQGTGAILSARKIVDMGDLHQLEDNKMRLTTFVQKVAKKPTTNPVFKWLTDELNPKEDAVNNGAGYSDSDTSVVVDNGGYFRIKDLVVVPRTAEVLLVTNISSNTLTVERSIGAPAAAALVDNDPLVILGPAYPEGATLQAARTTTEVENTNYTQIFRHPYHLTGTELSQGKSGGLYGGDDQTLQRGKKLLEHGRDINLTFYWGAAAASTTDSNLQRATGGLYQSIPTANRDAVTVLTETEWNDGLKSAFRYGSEEKVVFCSRKVAGILTEFMTNQQRVQPGDTKYGVKMVEYLSPHGTVNIVTDHAIEGGDYDKFCFVVDMNQLKYRFMKGRDTQLLLDRQAVDEDGIKEEYLTECGLETGEGRRSYAFNAIAS